MGGWIKLHRCITNSSVWDNPNILKVWLWCLCKASHSDTEHLVGLQVVELKTGQFIFGRKTASEQLDMPESSVWKYMKLLEKCGNIQISSNNKFSAITVENWAFYQGDDVQSEQQTNNKITTTKQQRDTNKNVKNVKNVKKYSENPDLDSAFKSYIEHRKQMKKPMTDNAINLAMKKLTTLADNDKDRIAIIEESIANGWQGLFALKKEQTKADEVKPKRYKEFEPVKEVKAEQMPDDLRKKLGGMFNYE